MFVYLTIKPSSSLKLGSTIKQATNSKQIRVLWTRSRMYETKFNLSLTKKDI